MDFTMYRGYHFISYCTTPFDPLFTPVFNTRSSESESLFRRSAFVRNSDKGVTDLNRCL